MLRIAVLSYWHVHAPEYTREIQEIPDTEITVVWDEIPTRGEEWADKIGAEFVSDLHEAVERDDVDAVIVTAPTNIHADVMVAAADAGNHIFTEKVLALTVDEADQIAAAVTSAEVEFCISYPKRTAPGLLFAKKAIEEGWLGQVTLLRSRVAHAGSVDGWLPEHFLELEPCGGGALIDLGAHPMYTIEYLMGLPQRLTARYNNVRKDIEVEDNAVAVMEYQNGSMAIAESSFSSRFSPFTVEAHGTEGTLFYGLPGDEVQIQSQQLAADGVEGRIAPSQLPEKLPSAIEQWVGAIRDGESPQFDLTAARNLTEMMEAANISAREDRPVQFPLKNS